MKNIKISVIMSVYNAKKYLHEAIESILNQTYGNFEFIIINDGSSDNSLEIINEYRDKDNRIIVIDQKNTGLTKALNIGLRKVTGVYVARMDADDISLPKRFENFIKYIEKTVEIDLYSTPSYVINESRGGKKIIPNYFRRNGFNQKLLNYYNSMIHGTLIVRADILKEFKYNEGYKYSQDFELYHKLIRSGYKISYDKDNITYELKIHSNSISNTKKSEQLKLYKQIFIDNNIKFYEKTLFNRVYFKLVDFYYYLMD